MAGYVLETTQLATTPGATTTADDGIVGTGFEVALETKQVAASPGSITSFPLRRGTSGGLPDAPTGYAYLTDASGNYLVDAPGNYLLGVAP